MLTLIGDILNWLAAGLLFPAMLLPLAGLARTKRAAALLWMSMLAFVVGGCVVFAALAADLNPPRLSPGLLATSAAGISITGAIVWRYGAAPLSARLSSAFDTLVRSLGRVSLFLVFAMALVQFCIVILRYVFGVNFIAMQESVTYMHGAVFLLAGGYALLTDDHVRVDIFYRSARPRTRALIDLLGTYLLLTPFCFVALWAAGSYVSNSWSVREGSMEQSGIQGVFLLKTLIPVYLILFLLAGFVNATRAAESLRSRSD